MSAKLKVMILGRRAQGNEEVLCTKVRTPLWLLRKCG